ncbi:hypothetical protein AXF42_Ash017479 [Apostasia shenzhenica]|uniref:Uncharacterized protein n=1 Tax=Apostasia shenzhenica TaxID=1088818 RepID=A0A2H9ZZ53_9ASPA|nr:hypothetical protein AXF42_Ash017479 [Apostasia shenzhenica]
MAAAGDSYLLSGETLHTRESIRIRYPATAAWTWRLTASSRAVRQRGRRLVLRHLQHLRHLRQRHQL